MTASIAHNFSTWTALHLQNGSSWDGNSQVIHSKIQVADGHIIHLTRPGHAWGEQPQQYPHTWAFQNSHNKRRVGLKAFGKSECLETQMSELMCVLGTVSSSTGLHPQDRGKTAGHSQVSELSSLSSQDAAELSTHL